MPEGSGRSTETPEATDFVAFFMTGQPATGEFHCSQCGYGVIVERELPRCPMCSGTAWEQPGWSAISRRATERLQ
jgi:rubrerythrin